MSKVSDAASVLARKRWKNIPPELRRAMMPRGGRPRIYPKCPRYSAHRFSPVTDRCPCGYYRPEVPPADTSEVIIDDGDVNRSMIARFRERLAARRAEQLTLQE